MMRSRHDKINTRRFLPSVLVLLILLGFFVLPMVTPLTYQMHEASKIRFSILKNEALQSEVSDAGFENKAFITISPNQTIFDTFIINRGKKDGIQEGLLVAHDETLLGSVSRVNDGSSIVESFGRSGAANISGVIKKDLSFNTQEIGISRGFDDEIDLKDLESIDPDPQIIPGEFRVELEGLGRGAFFSKISRGYDIQVGDTIESLANPGYVLAIVEAIDFEEQDSFKSVYASTMINPRELIFVDVISSGFAYKKDDAEYIFDSLDAFQKKELESIEREEAKKAQDNESISAEG